MTGVRDRPRNVMTCIVLAQIWMQTKARVTHFVAGGSTGGTISGTGRFLKDMNPNIHVMLPDPVGSVFWDFWVNRKAEKDLKAASYQVTRCSAIPLALHKILMSLVLRHQ